MPSPTLKPRPFCGGQARAYLKISLSADEPEKPLIEARVQCLGCTAEVFGLASIGTPLSPFAVADTSGNAAILRAVAAWNRRAGEDETK